MRNLIFVLFILLAFSTTALALPALQVYIPGATAGTQGDDEDTWFYNSAGDFNFSVVGADSPDGLLDLTNTTLVVSVPIGESGTVSILDGASTAVELLNVAGESVPGTYNPLMGANIDILTNVDGLDAYNPKTNFYPDLPTELSWNDHFPFKDRLSNFILFDLGALTDSDETLYDYNADGGTITSVLNEDGEIKDFSIFLSGFTTAHLDVYALGADGDWYVNPNSHDATWNYEDDGGGGGGNLIPEPSTFVLLGAGLVGLAVYRRKRD